MLILYRKNKTYTSLILYISSCSIHVYVFHSYVSYIIRISQLNRKYFSSFLVAISPYWQSAREHALLFNRESKLLIQVLYSYGQLF